MKQWWDWCWEKIDTEEATWTRRQLRKTLVLTIFGCLASYVLTVERVGWAVRHAWVLVGLWLTVLYVHKVWVLNQRRRRWVTARSMRS